MDVDRWKSFTAGGVKHRFVKGQIANPRGRPRLRFLKLRAKKVLEKNAPLVIDRIATALAAGRLDPMLMESVAPRMRGTVLPLALLKLHNDTRYEKQQKEIRELQRQVAELRKCRCLGECHSVAKVEHAGKEYE